MNILISDNGPILITSIAQKFCPGTNFSFTNFTECDGFNVLPCHKCYPIEYPQWRRLYEENYAQEVMTKIDEFKSYFVHFWNMMQHFNNSTYKLPFTSKCAYVELARKFCPRVYQQLERSF